MACSRLSDSRDDAVKGVQKYERVNLRKGGRWRLLPYRAFSIWNWLAWKKLRFCLSSGTPPRKSVLTPTSLLYDSNCFRMFFFFESQLSFFTFSFY